MDSVHCSVRISYEYRWTTEIQYRPFNVYKKPEIGLGLTFLFRAREIEFSCVELSYFGTQKDRFPRSAQRMMP